MSTTYEWDVETMEHGEILGRVHSDTALEAINYMRRNACLLETGQKFALVLVRDDDDGRSWTYVRSDGTLPPHFHDAYENEVAKMPRRFYDELRTARRYAEIA